MTDRTAWRCPDCGVMHAPHVDQCDCTGVNAVAREAKEQVTVAPEPAIDLQKLHDMLDKMHPPSKPWDIDRFPRPWESIRRTWIGDLPGWLDSSTVAATISATEGPPYTITYANSRGVTIYNSDVQ